VIEIKITLATPHTEAVAQSQYHRIPQLGLGYLAAAVLDAGHECAIVDAKMSHLGLPGLAGRIVDSELDHHEGAGPVGFCGIGFVGRIVNEPTRVKKPAAVWITQQPVLLTTLDHLSKHY
jgi:hypothetical protein